MPPAISVLMPVYNGAPTLTACLASTLQQTCDDFELVVVDDGSTDATPGLLADAAARDSRVRVLTATHEGIVAALNRGLAACRGEFIARMDADDRMLPRRLERQLAVLRERPEWELAGGQVRAVGIGKELSAGGLRYHDWLNSLACEAAIRHGMFVDSPIAHSTFFARRALYERLGGYRAAPWAEDYDLLLRAQHEGARLGTVADVVLERGDRPGRLTRTDPRYKRKRMFQAKAHYFAQGPWLAGRDGIIIAGTGPSGRVLAAALRAEGVEPLGFLDNRAGPPGRTVMAIPAHGFPAGPPPEFFAAHRGAFFAICVGDDPSRADLTSRLTAAGMCPSRDYLRFV